MPWVEIGHGRPWIKIHGYKVGYAYGILIDFFSHGYTYYLRLSQHASALGTTDFVTMDFNP